MISKLCPTHHAAQMSRTVASGMETDRLRIIGPGQACSRKLNLGAGLVHSGEWWGDGQKADT